MRSRSELKPYQETLIQKILDTPKTGLFLDMGLGKTVITLSSVAELFARKVVTKVLVIAPLRVANTVWGKEIASWEHLRHLTFSVATGKAEKRLEALDAPVQIVLINVDNVIWLCDTGQIQNFDMIVIDESSKFKSFKNKRFRSLKQCMGKIHRVVLLTGTPAPEGAEDLWSQIYLLDSGKRLGKTISRYRSDYFIKTSNYVFSKYVLRPDMYPKILEKVSDIVFSLTSKDVLIPNEVLWKTIYTEIPENTKAIVRSLSKTFVATLPDKSEISVPSAGVLLNKLLQISNGAVYDEGGKFHVLHTQKLDALRELREDNPQENLLVAYIYKSDLERLRISFPEAVCLSETPDAEERWNRGEISMLLAHPKSAAHGLNLQYGGSVCVWFGLTWSLEEWKQFNKRLDRPGQKGVVRIIPILSEDSIDSQIFSALQVKDITQKEVISRLKIPNMRSLPQVQCSD